MNPIYLDHNSTTRINPDVARTIAEFHAAGYVNPASAHRPGQLARRKLEELRSQIIGWLGGNTTGRDTDQLLFTSGGTESNNLAIRGLTGPPSGRVLISAIEHPSVLGAAQSRVPHGFEVRKIPVDDQGICRLDELQRLLVEDDVPTRLVSVMLVNNETGVIQPIAEIAAICHGNGALLHVDAVQAVAKIDVNFRELGIDAMSFTAHKFHGPRGIGGLLLRPGISLQPLFFGGFQQMALRPGTEDVALAAGMHRALELFVNDAPGRTKHLRTLRDTLEAIIVGAMPNTVINSGRAPRAPHALNLSFPGLNRQAFLMAADIAGLAISTGSACASGSSEPSHVLLAMGAEKDIVEGSIRISVGADSTMSEIEDAASRIILIVKDLRRAR
jgi:cysteine desulfurase